MALMLSRADVMHCLDMTEAIEAMPLAFGALSAGQAQAPQRTAIGLADQGIALLMPSLLQTVREHAFGLKVVTVMPQNPPKNLPRISASVLLLDGATGKTQAILEGRWLTAMRTGAASGLATSLLARQDADVLAIHAARPLQEVRVVNRNDEHYRQLVASLHALLGPTCPAIRRAATARETLAGALLVACATTATAPLFRWSEVARGAHINAIGAFTPQMCEVDAETLAHARIVVDERVAALIEAGDLLQALANDRIAGAETWIELGELVRGTRAGRQAAEEVTVFKSVGIAVQDVAVALHVYARARELGIGIEVDI